MSCRCLTLAWVYWWCWVVTFMLSITLTKKECPLCTLQLINSKSEINATKEKQRRIVNVGMTRQETKGLGRKLVFARLRN